MISIIQSIESSESSLSFNNIGGRKRRVIKERDIEKGFARSVMKVIDVYVHVKT